VTLPIVFRQVRIFDGVSVLPADTVIIQEGLISAVGSHLTFPPSAIVINGTRQTLLPGLIDAHTHTFDPSNLRRALIFGVTTEFDMFTDWHLAQEIKALQKRGEGHDLADLRSAGTLITAPGGHGTEYGLPIPTITEPTEAQAFIDARIEEGSDYIKIVYDDCSYATGQLWPTLSKETLAAVIEAAHRRGKLAVVHMLRRRDAEDAIEVGVDGLAHLFVDQLPDAGFNQSIVASPVFVIPTLSILEYVCGRPDASPLMQHPHFAPYLSLADRTRLQRRFTYRFGSYDVAEAMVRQLKAMGLPILAGTDAPLGTIHGASLHRELELLVKAGLTPMEALAAATSVPARVFGLSDRGRIAEGMRADLVLVEGDPTSTILATRAISAVWKQGKEVDRQAYQALLEQEGREQK